MSKGRTDPDLDRLVAKWQKILRLDAWSVVASYRRAYDMDAMHQGRINWVDRRREAVLAVLDPADYDPACIFPQDVERTVCHELMHLLLAPLDREESKVQIEQIMHVLDKVLADALRDR